MASLSRGKIPRPRARVWREQAIRRPRSIRVERWIAGIDWAGAAKPAKACDVSARPRSVLRAEGWQRTDSNVCARRQDIAALIALNNISADRESQCFPQLVNLDLQALRSIVFE